MRKIEEKGDEEDQKRKEMREINKLEGIRSRRQR